jgi:hypothetical protein
MILIKHIDFEYVQGDVATIRKDSRHLMNFEEGKEETIYGQHFWRVNTNERFTIGMSKQVRDILGIQIDTIENIQSQVYIQSMVFGKEKRKLKTIINKLKNQIDKTNKDFRIYRNANRWTRAKRVFTTLEILEGFFWGAWLKLIMI